MASAGLLIIAALALAARALWRFFLQKTSIDGEFPIRKRLPKLGRSVQADHAAAVDDLFHQLAGARGLLSFDDLEQWWTQREHDAGLVPDDDSMELAQQLFDAYGGVVDGAQLRGVLLHVMQAEWIEAGEDRNHVYWGNLRTGESAWERPDGKALDETLIRDQLIIGLVQGKGH